MTLSIKMRKRKSDATSAFECSAWPLIGVSSERQIAYAQICYFLLSDKQTKAPRQETAQFTETAAQHSREAADGLNQDKVRFWFTVRERLSALPHLQCLLHDGFTFLLLHFHIVNRHVAANHSTELRQWCGSVELQARTYAIKTAGGIKREAVSPFHEHLHGVPLQTGLLLKDFLLQHQAFSVTVIPF